MTLHTTLLIILIVVGCGYVIADCRSVYLEDVK